MQIIKGLKITGATVLLGFATLLIAAGLYAPLNGSISKQRQVEQSSACLLMGVPMAVWGGWIVRGLRRDKQKEAQDRLNAAFTKLLALDHGRITTLAFSLESGLTGAAAKAYLDDRAREFNANFDVDEEGNLAYRFHVGKFNQGKFNQA